MSLVTLSSWSQSPIIYWSFIETEDQKSSEFKIKTKHSILRVSTQNIKKSNPSIKKQQPTNKQIKKQTSDSLSQDGAQHACIILESNAMYWINFQLRLIKLTSLNGSILRLYKGLYNSDISFTSLGWPYKLQKSLI